MYIVLYQNDIKTYPDAHYFKNKDDALKVANYAARMYSVDYKVNAKIKPHYMYYPDGKDGQCKDLIGYSVIDNNGDLRFMAELHQLEEWKVKNFNL